MPVTAAIAFLFVWLCLAVSFLLRAYLEIRIHALVQTGDLPKEALKWFRGRWSHNLWNPGYGSDLKFLFSPEFKGIDSHTRRLVPIIHVALGLAAAGFFACVVLLMLA